MAMRYNVIVNIVTPSEFAKLFKITRITVYALIKSGKLPAIKLGQQWRIDTDAIKPENLKEQGGDAKNFENM